MVIILKKIILPIENKLFMQKFLQTLLYEYFACLSVCLYSINVKTAEPIGPNFHGGPHIKFANDLKWPNFR